MQASLHVQQIGQLGGCWGTQAAGASPPVPLLGHIPQPCRCSAPCSASHVGRHSVLNTVPPMAQHRKGSTGMAWSWSPLPLGSHPRQHRVPWQGNRAGASPTAPRHSTLSKSISAHPPPPPCSCHTCPVLWPQLNSCLISARNHSFILRVRKETAHCQISYLRGNILSFIELPITGPGLFWAVPVMSTWC